MLAKHVSLADTLQHTFEDPIELSNTQSWLMLDSIAIESAAPKSQWVLGLLLQDSMWYRYIPLARNSLVYRPASYAERCQHQ